MLISRRAAFSLSEMLIAVALISIIAVLVVPFVLSSFNKDETHQMQTTSTIDSLAKVFHNQESKNGLIPRELAPSEVVLSQIATQKTTAIAADGSVPSGCSQVALPAKKFELGNQQAAYVSQQWTQPESGRDDYTYVCVSDASGNASVKQVFRGGEEKGTLNTTMVVDTGSGSGGSEETDEDDDGSLGGGGSVTSECLVSLPSDTHAKSLLAQYGQLRKTAKYIVDHPTSNSITVQNRYISVLNAIFKGSNNVYAYAVYTPSFSFYIRLRKIPPLTGYTHYISSSLRTLPYAARAALPDGTPLLIPSGELSTLDAKFPGVEALANYWAAITSGGMHAHYSALSVLNQLSKAEDELKAYASCANAQDTLAQLQEFEQILYELVVDGDFSSPVKVNLKGKDAVLNSDNRVLFAPLGRKSSNSLLVVRTAGSLNPDEAWLVADRGASGFYDKALNDVLDGDDVFGDHHSRFVSGYEDLQGMFKAEILKDATNKRYIPLHEMPWWEKAWVWILRFFGFAKEPIASYDLKLLTPTHQVLDAGSVLNRVYVDYDNVNELDAAQLNWIRQRAVVEYKDGHTASSADQWFRVELVSPLRGRKS